MGAWLCTSSRNVAQPERVPVDSSPIEREQRGTVRPVVIQTTVSTSTGITNSVRKNASKTSSTSASTIVESTPSTASKEGDERMPFAESQFYARTSNTPLAVKRPQQFDPPKEIVDDRKPEPIEIPSAAPKRPLSNSALFNPFERLRPMEISKPPAEDLPPPFPDLSIQSISITDPADENNDSSASTTTTTTSRSIHLPVEKQRGLSEVIRKRNSKFKVEDYKRSIQKSGAVDEEEGNSPELAPKYFEVPINQQNTNDQRTQLSIERLNFLLSKDEEAPQSEDNASVGDKRNRFEGISKDAQPDGAAVARSKSFKTEESAPTTKKYANGSQRSQTENILQNDEKATYDDDTSKLSFREKMTLFNKNKSIGLAPTSSLKSRNRLTQPITAEEVQAAANLTPSSSTKQLAEEANEPEHILPVSKRLEQFKSMGKAEDKPAVSEPKPRPIMKYSAKKTNTEPEQRAKTVDIVRLKADSTVKPKEIHKTTDSTITKPSTKNVISVLKSDTVSVLRPDDHLDDFFADAKKTPSTEANIQLNTDDLNRIAANTTRLQTQAPRVRPPRRQQQGAKNPLRQIQANLTTENEYTEVHTNLSEQELRRLKRAQIAENAGVAQEALAALTSNENFAEINLRKIDQPPLMKSAFEPYKDRMLILVKGRRACSLRLVNPTYQSINEGDCYLLLTPLKVFAWFGRHANGSERARTTDLIDYLKQHRDFGLRNEVKYFLLDQGKDDTENDLHAEFRDILSGEIDDYQLVDDVLDDDFYEANVTDLNRVYRVEEDLLLPLNEYCFHPLSVKLLDPNEVLLFDFGSELYVWNGKLAEKNKRNMGLQLAQQLWKEIYDPSECIIHPFDPLNDQIKFEKSARPDWCLLGKQNQNVETLLFKGKFSDWPSDFEELKSNLDAPNATGKLPPTQRPLSIVETLKPADVYQMLDNAHPPVNLIVEQINLGRGRSWLDPRENHGHHIQTIALSVWHVDDNNRQELAKSSYGQFYSDDVYIIRWKYKLVPIGHERKADVNRERVIYWIWQGVNANLNEKGISGLLSVFLSEEKGAHIHVNQEHEEAAFLQLFEGAMMINLGQHQQLNDRGSPWRLHIFLGEIDCETHWWEVHVHGSSLRSRTSFLLLNATENLILLWHGCQTTEHQQNLAKQSVMKLREKCPREFHFDGSSDDIEFFEMQEGDEIELFWEAIAEKSHARKYHSALDQPSLSLPAIRLYHLSSLHGPFIAQELTYRLHAPEHPAVFPFQQLDLYELHQPALCLIDAQSEIFIWQGWNEHIDEETKGGIRGPKDIRFTTERRCAFQTAVDYYKTKTGSATVEIPCSVVYAGLEPLEFSNLFPKWNVHIKARQQNQLEGKKPNQKDSAIDLLHRLCRSQYSIAELRARPLPEGVDPSKIESYLSEADFQNEFHLNKDEFYALPYWKQTNIKKPLGFF